MKKIKFLSVLTITPVMFSGFVASSCKNNENEKIDNEKSTTSVEVQTDISNKNMNEFNLDENIVNVNYSFNVSNEYNIAFLTGTMPVLIFQTSHILNDPNFKYMHHVKQNQGNDEIPSYIWVDRNQSLNYDYLPKNEHLNPFISKEDHIEYDTSKHIISKYDNGIEKTLLLTRSILEKNPEAKINFYINDYNSYLYFLFITLSKVKNYHFYLLTDGSFTEVNTLKIFNNHEPDNTLSEYKEYIKSLAKRALKNKSINYWTWKDLNLKFQGQISPLGLKMYDSENVSMIANKYTFSKLIDNNNITDEFKLFTNNVILPNITDNNLGKTFSEISKSDEKLTLMKKNYNLSNSLYGENFNHENTLIILGTHNRFEKGLFLYSEVLKILFPQYKIYYKGHPATPSVHYPTKINEFKNMEINDINSSIPAELLFSFNNELNVAGWTSTTFDSDDVKHIKAVFNLDPDNKLNNDKRVDYSLLYINKKEINHNRKYDDKFDSDEAIIVLPINKTDKDFDYAVYDSVKKQLVKYNFE
ncbi:hypothetical protein KQ872_00865 [Mycoplasma sp. ES3225-GEN-MYC]|uniref:hypothetical protein n=1 Tax=Mycoplasma miroungigenitalium TaxID=754515 RepID=UPI001C0FD96A|nr:hypothetical protein [Mycoplasma miroungigenitalium]MBU4691519.1 hypothetical protein [Mycoplasma miroungigenitalium]